jgi:hypothetical protein
MAYGHLVIFADVRIQAQCINIFDSLVIPRLVMQIHEICSTPVQRVSRPQWTARNDWMGQQIRFLFRDLCTVPLALPLRYHFLSTMHFLFQSRYSSFVTLGQSFPTQHLHVPKVFARTAMIVAAVEFENGARLGTVSVHAVPGQFGQSTFATVPRDIILQPWVCCICSNNIRAFLL